MVMPHERLLLFYWSMEMLRSETVFAMSLTELDLPPLTTHAFVRFIFNRPDVPERELIYGSATITIGEVISMIEQRDDRVPGKTRMDAFKAKLVEHGLSTLDWSRLPQSSITPEVIRSRSKEEWLMLPALYLKAVTTPLLEVVSGMRRYESGIKKITVAELLRLCSAEGQNISRIQSLLLRANKVGYLATKRMLMEIGFVHSDGPFMQAEEVRAEAMALAQKHRLNLAEAELVLRIARVENWVN